MAFDQSRLPLMTGIRKKDTAASNEATIRTSVCPPFRKPLQDTILRCADRLARCLHLPMAKQNLTEQHSNPETTKEKQTPCIPFFFAKQLIYRSSR
jgi:hypothetical protein